MLATRKEHNISGQAIIPEVYTYTYDKAERLLTTTYQLNNKTAITLASNTYDELGRLVTNYRHNSTDTVSYAYNIRNLTFTIKSGAFIEELFYNKTDLNYVTPYYNGNIAASTWIYNGVRKAYTYTYDGLNRLTLATGYQTSGRTFYAPNNREQFDYDKQGNTVRLWRDRDYTCMDFLQMYYYGNQVNSIYDSGTQQNLSSVKEYINNANLSTEFIYDKNGNMTTDLDRKIVSIRYKILNLPDTIQFSTGNQIINRYAADGRKLRTIYYTWLPGTTAPIVNAGDVLTINYPPSTIGVSGTFYVGNFEYDLKGRGSMNLSRIYNAEGYVEDVSNPQYYYFRKDHLGNNREVWLANTNTTVQRTQYYPSGLPWASNAGDNPGVQERKYNGKEFVEMHGYDTYDYGARGYYPAMGRFTSVDPLAEMDYSVSPYMYCEGDPVSKIDPTGMANANFDVFDQQPNSFKDILFENQFPSLRKANASYFEDHYFNELGKHLGEDEVESDNNKIVTQKTWDQFKTVNSDNTESIDHRSGAIVSIDFSSANLSTNASLSVYNYYNTSGLPLVDSPSGLFAIGETGMSFQSNGTRAVDIAVDINGLKKIKVSDHANEITNFFVHEICHYSNFITQGAAVYKNTPPNVREQKAIKLQMSDPTFLKMRPDIQKAWKNYGVTKGMTF